MKSGKYLLILTISVLGCRKPYAPPAITAPNGYLVVEGVINAGSDSTTIKLSHTVNISSNITKNPVSGATVTVESDQLVTFPLPETTNGNYASAGLNLDTSHKYRLNIKTTNNKQYQSDFVLVRVTPPIDSIGFNIVNVPDTGIVIYANTHDANNNTRYYRWDYNEDWQFNAKYVSNFITNGTAIVPRPANQRISVCYSNDLSSDIVLGSSARLQNNLIYQNPIIFIASTSEKIEDEYSILLREYALTADAYNFWVSLKKNTEQLGSIFDAQPSQLNGNIHCLTNKSEAVIGYLSVCTVSSKRAFIYSKQLPVWVPTYPYTCQQDSEYYARPRNGHNDVAAYLIPLSSVLVPTNSFIVFPKTTLMPDGYLASSRECVDCTIRGTKIPPPFWR